MLYIDSATFSMLKTIGILVLVIELIYAAISWKENTFGVKIQEVLYTIVSPMKGADASFLWKAVWYVVPRMLVTAVLYLVTAYIRVLADGQSEMLQQVFDAVMVIGVIIFAFITLRKCDKNLDIIQYISGRLGRSTIYEDRYVDPKTVSISVRDNGKPKNVIYIYLESMENTYASADVGGYQVEHNYIPHLTDMAFDEGNTSFSNTDKLGGFHSTTGATWTAGAIFAGSSGIPFTFPVLSNELGKKDSFAAGVTTIGDVLKDKGYYQEFLCGSDSSFAGRNYLFKQHGDYEIFDYNIAIEKGYIDKDYYVWWGFEDTKLYDIARDELLRISQQDQPFNFTMLTVDTHHVDGYVCDLCGDEYDDQIANVLACADKQIYEFINWCKEQDFYKDTVIVITGDHPRMDTSIVKGAPDRTVYNCILNADGADKVKVSGRTHNRTFTTMDMFPTVLSAMGFDIEGDRLGLGTDMFSDKDTLAEEMGLDKFSRELEKRSKYYVEKFPG